MEPKIKQSFKLRLPKSRILYNFNFIIVKKTKQKLRRKHSDNLFKFLVFSESFSFLFLDSREDCVHEGEGGAGLRPDQTISQGNIWWHVTPCLYNFLLHIHKTGLCCLMHLFHVFCFCLVHLDFKFFLQRSSELLGISFWLHVTPCWRI